MTRNQQLKTSAKDLSDGVMFTVDGSGNITPTTQQTVCAGYTILTQACQACTTQFSGKVCAQQSNVCQCSALVAGLSSGQHMAIGTQYTVNTGVPLNSQFELYAVTGSGTVVPSVTNGDIYVGA
jgi:hypothetical protein